MTAKKCVQEALNGREPEWVPTFEWILNPDVMEAMTGTRDEMEFVEKTGIDGIAIGTDMKHEFVDEKHYKDEWGITRVSWDEYPNPVGHPVQTLDDFKKLNIPDPDADYRFDKIKTALDRFGDEKSIIIRLRDVFSQPRDLMGFENFLMAFYTDPDLVDELMRISVEYNTKLAKNAKEIGGKIIVVGDDVADNSGLMMSPDMYKKQIFPRFKELISNFKEMDFLVIKHTDGKILDIMDLLVESGIDCIDPIDPLAGMNIAEMKKDYGDKLCLKGNIDCVKTLVNKTQEEVKKETIECILAASPGGGHVISSSNSIHRGINPENYKTFLDTIKEYGTYPIDKDRLTKEVNRLCL